MSITLNINGRDQQVDASEDTPLLWAIRDSLQLTGTKFGCGLAQCGACTVQLDGQPIRSCVTPISAVAGAKITTIEGLEDKVTQALQQSWQELQVAQCGYCQSGQIVAASALLKQNPAPSEEQISQAMSGNICRCHTYQRINQGIADAAERLAKEVTNA